MPYKDPAARAAHNREWRLKNRTAVRTCQRAKHLRRKHGGGLSTADVRAALDALCAYCLEAPATEVEHCTPLCRGGENEVDNIVGACRQCNGRKHTRTVLEFFCLWPTENPF